MTTAISLQLWQPTGLSGIWWTGLLDWNTGMA